MIYLASKKAYLILNKHDGSIKQTVALNNQTVPQICLAKGKSLVLNNGNCGYFMDTHTGMKKAIVFKFEKYPSTFHGDKGQIIQILMHEIYVIVVFEVSIAIFNS